jgi:heat shock protein HslJ
MLKIPIGFVLIASLGFVSGCAAPAPLPTPTPSVQYDWDWLLASGTDNQGAWVDGDEGAIRLTINDGQVSGQICNSWSGDIDINGSSVAMTSLFSTKMACDKPDGIMDRETRFLNDLALVTSIELVDGRLRLSGEGVELEFVGSY